MNTVLQISTILQTVADFYRMDVEKIVPLSRKADIVKIRHITIWFARRFLCVTDKRIANELGQESHTISAYAHDAIEYQVKNNKALRSEIKAIYTNLQNQMNYELAPLELP